MSAANTDKFRKVVRSFTTTLSTPGITDSATNIPIPSVAAAELPTDTAVTITIDRVNSSGVATPSLREDITGVADPGNNRITSAVRTEGQAHNTGAVVEITWTESVWNDAVDAILLEHNQAGKHKPEKIDQHRYAADAGSTDSYAITLDPVPAAYVTGQLIYFKANTLNTGAATVNVNSLGAKNLKKIDSTGKIDLATGDIIANQFIAAVYDGTDFVIISPLAQVVTSQLADKVATDAKRDVTYYDAACPTSGTNATSATATGSVLTMVLGSGTYKALVFGYYGQYSNTNGASSTCDIRKGGANVYPATRLDMNTAMIDKGHPTAMIYPTTVVNGDTFQCYHHVSAGFGGFHTQGGRFGVIILGKS